MEGNEAGAGGKIQKLAMKPGEASGNYSKHFDRVAELRVDANHYEVPVPLHRRSDGVRHICRVPISAPHDVLADDLREHGIEHLRGNHAAAELPRAALEHPLKLANPTAYVRPLILYMDGVKYAREDNCLGIWLTCLVTGRKWVLAVLQKSTLCRCGCRGWCSVWPLFWALRWSFRALAAGEYPSERHDGMPLDPDRMAFAGCALGFMAYVLFVKGDWMEFVATLGFPSWATLLHPCIRCCAVAGTMHELRNLSVFTMPWPEKLFGQYRAACASCEITVVLNEALWRRLRVALVQDRRVGGNRGRCLNADIAGTPLQRGDRLEPSPDVPDTGEGFDAAMPHRATFWRRASESVTRHRNPLFDDEFYLTPDRCVVFDYLHCCCLGVYQDFLAWLIWLLIELNVYGISDGFPMEVRLKMSAEQLRVNLFAWYKQERSAGRARNQVQDFTATMLGTRTAPAFKLHGAETDDFILFAGVLIERFGNELGDRRETISACQSAFATIRQLTRDYKTVLPDPQVQTFVTAVRTALASFKTLGIPEKPKEPQGRETFIAPNRTPFKH